MPANIFMMIQDHYHKNTVVLFACFYLYWNSSEAFKEYTFLGHFYKKIYADLSVLFLFYFLSWRLYFIVFLSLNMKCEFY